MSIVDVKEIVEKKKSGVLLSVIGTGLFNLQDDKLGALSKNGNGNYCTVDSFTGFSGNSIALPYLAVFSAITLPSSSWNLYVYESFGNSYETFDRGCVRPW